MKKAFNLCYNFPPRTNSTKEKSLSIQRLSINVTSNSKTLTFYSGLHLFSDLISKFEIKAIPPPFFQGTHWIFFFNQNREVFEIFFNETIEHLKDFLPALAFRIRLWHQLHLYKIVFRMDGTLHEQFGEKMKGVEWNYKKFKGLSGENLFDDGGLGLGFGLPNGSNHSSVGMVEMRNEKVIQFNRT